jgi:hypothetical protein
MLKKFNFFLFFNIQNVRERLGSVLTNIFLCDMEFGVNGESSITRCPKISDFINEILPQLEIMAVEPEPTTTPGNINMGLYNQAKMICFTTLKDSEARISQKLSIASAPKY